MQGYVACTIQIILLIINRILKREKMIHRISINRGRKMMDFYKTVKERFAEIYKLEKKFTDYHLFTEKSLVCQLYVQM